MDVKIGQTGEMHCAGTRIAVAGKPETAVYTVVKIGRKKIHLHDHQGKLFLVDIGTLYGPGVTEFVPKTLKEIYDWKPVRMY